MFLYVGAILKATNSSFQKSMIFGRSIHLRNLLTHTFLFWHFLKNWNFELKNILEYIRAMFSGNVWLFSHKTDEEYLKY